MSIITMKKIIAIALIAIMIITMTMPVFGASNASKIKTIRNIFKKATEHMKKVIVLVSEILNPGGGGGSGGEEPIITTKSMNTIAKECKKVLRVNGFTYQYAVDYNFKDNPPSASTTSKKMNCSAYVSWVIYEYAEQKGKTTLMNDFKNDKTSGEILNYLKNDTTNFKYIGKLSSLSSSSLKAGDIIVKNGHAEIFGKYDTNYTNKYRCYNAGSSDAMKSGGDTGELTGGACNDGPSNYSVYRVNF